MVTISVCMIVKNEEAILERCLYSLQGIWDELIIVDTGSTDKTKEIAGKYTDKVYDFEWVGDFSKARNFSIEKATCDYIYTADADEELDEENRQKFIRLKQALVRDIDIVQMKYVNQLDNGTVYNFDSEYRAKLYKRVRKITFVDPVHEMVRTEPLVFDSDIDIIHRPQGMHAGRDLQIFERMLEKGETVSSRLIRMYARELLLAGTKDNFEKAADFFEKLSEEAETDGDRKLAYIIMAAVYEKRNDAAGLMKYALRDMIGESCSEICCILGAFYERAEDYTEASVWYYNACFETKPEVCVKYADLLPLEGLVRVYEALGDEETAKNYRSKLG